MLEGKRRGDFSGFLIKIEKSDVWKREGRPRARRYTRLGGADADIVRPRTPNDVPLGERAAAAASYRGGL